MDSRLLHYYNQELRYMREMGAEFARDYPKIASRLGIDGLECADPYVERLLEGFSLLAARVQVKLDAQFPQFTQHLLEIVYPQYLAPTPSMLIAQFHPNHKEGSLKDGFVLPRHTVLRGRTGKGDATPCQYRTAHATTLWPVEIAEAEYLASSGAVAAGGGPEQAGTKAAIRLRLRTLAGNTWDKLPLDRLTLHLCGGGSLPVRILEQMLGNCIGMAVQPAQRPPRWTHALDKRHVRAVGFEDEEALLPYGARDFHGYRLLHEYFAFPQRFLFVELSGLKAAVRHCETDELDILVLLNRAEPMLDRTLDASNFALFCTPAVNLFPKRADRINLDGVSAEHHVIPDRGLPMDYEVYQITGIQGYGPEIQGAQAFEPFYALRDHDTAEDGKAYFATQRYPRQHSSRQRERGARSSYLGSETFVSLVDTHQAPYRSDLRQLGVDTLCTNRDLPLLMPLGGGQSDFTLERGAPVEAVRCLSGPTRPRAPYAQGEAAWHLISHLSLNYLSLMDTDEREGAVALRSLLALYADARDADAVKQIEGVRAAHSAPIVRRIPHAGPIAVGRGLEITVDMDESAFEGSGIFLLGAVLNRFFAQYVSINAFTETVIRSVDRGEVMRWPSRTGLRRTL